MDKRILLVCSAGMSTSLLVQKMKKVAESQGKKYEIWATPVDDIVDDDKEFDCVLIAPQVSGKIEDVKESVAEFGDDIPMAVIEKNDYGKMNAEAVIALAEKILGVE